MHSLKKAQIAHLNTDKAVIKVSSKYTDFIDIFLLKLAIELLKHTKINNHTIELVDNWQLLYSLIYSLSLMKLEILKTYIESNYKKVNLKAYIINFQGCPKEDAQYKRKKPSSIQDHVNKAEEF